MAGVQVRPVEQRDHDRWRELYKGYTDFYHEMAERVWGWVQGPGPELECLVAVDDNDRAVALAHFRPFVRPLRSTIAGFLDDLFVDPDHRGGGAADALLARLREIARERGWASVRWLTSENNYRAGQVRQGRSADDVPHLRHGALDRWGPGGRSARRVLVPASPDVVAAEGESHAGSGRAATLAAGPRARSRMP